MASAKSASASPSPSDTEVPVPRQSEPEEDGSNKSEKSAEDAEEGQVQDVKEQDNSEARLHATTYKPVQDDGWDPCWDDANQAWYFYNRFTGKTQWENPRAATTTTAPAGAPGTAPPLPTESNPQTVSVPKKPRAGGYNPAIHGDYDPNADYAKEYEETEEDNYIQPPLPNEALSSEYGQSGAFNRFTGRFQAEGVDSSNHSDAAKSKRQLNAFFDVDAAANSHDGRSLKAERQNMNLSKSQVKEFKKKRRDRKEEKRRAWLRD